MDLNRFDHYSTQSSINTTNEPEITLNELNDIYAQDRLGGMVFVGILMIIGIIGNAHVIYLYAFKFPKTTHRIYILWLALVDMVTCSVGMPFVIVDLRNPLMFDQIWICKILRFVNYFNSACSGFLLLLIAIDRFRKICRPLKQQISEKDAISIGLIGMAIAGLLALPAPVLYGRSTVETKYPGITGTACFTEDRFKNTNYQAYYNGVLLLITLVTLVAMVCLYMMVGRTIWRQTKRRIQLNLSSRTSIVAVDSLTNTTSFDNSKVRSSTKQASKSSPQISSNTASSSSTDNKKNQVTMKPKKKQNNKTKLSRMSQTKRITLMLFIITVVYILAFLPHLGLKITIFLNKNFLNSISHAGVVLHHTFVWSFFINNMANPIIYGFCDSRFRQYLKEMYKGFGKAMYKADVV